MQIGFVQLSNLLANLEVGMFVVRGSSQPDSYALSYVDSSTDVVHSLINKTPSGFILPDIPAAVFPTLEALVSACNFLMQIPKKKTLPHQQPASPAPPNVNNYADPYPAIAAAVAGASTTSPTNIQSPNVQLSNVQTPTPSNNAQTPNLPIIQSPKPSSVQSSKTSNVQSPETVSHDSSIAIISEAFTDRSAAEIKEALKASQYDVTAAIDLLLRTPAEPKKIVEEAPRVSQKIESPRSIPEEQPKERKSFNVVNVFLQHIKTNVKYSPEYIDENWARLPKILDQSNVPGSLESNLHKILQNTDHPLGLKMDAFINNYNMTITVPSYGASRALAEASNFVTSLQNIISSKVESFRSPLGSQVAWRVIVSVLLPRVYENLFHIVTSEFAAVNSDRLHKMKQLVNCEPAVFLGRSTPVSKAQLEEVAKRFAEISRTIPVHNRLSLLVEIVQAISDLAQPAVTNADSLLCYFSAVLCYSGLNSPMAHALITRTFSPPFVIEGLEGFALTVFETSLDYVHSNSQAILPEVTFRNVRAPSLGVPRSADGSPIVLSSTRNPTVNPANYLSVRMVANHLTSSDPQQLAQQYPYIRKETRTEEPPKEIKPVEEPPVVQPEPNFSGYGNLDDVFAGREQEKSQAQNPAPVRATATLPSLSPSVPRNHVVSSPNLPRMPTAPAPSPPVPANASWREQAKVSPSTSTEKVNFQSTTSPVPATTSAASTPKQPLNLYGSFSSLEASLATPSSPSKNSPSETPTPTLSRPPIERTSSTTSMDDSEFALHRAEIAYIAALRDAPRSAKNLNKLAAHYNNKHNFAKAVEHTKEALKADPNDIIAKNNLPVFIKNLQEQFNSLADPNDIIAKNNLPVFIKNLQEQFNSLVGGT
ncbi:hypothetical protein PROFUN_03780 [Planoprotostelium fungivorum]|uniref:VPS9 domain-containing protein n=1 Tax=Planoprotostelium fungivorum TaxID=1890364 RepID=A0A2P6NDR8_9EUKA|nr:hypothetical protein PROFUN_03780 [Planoprotostelium fungivorum]